MARGDELASRAIPRGEDVDDADVQRHLADAYATRALVDVTRQDWDAAIADHGRAADLTTDALHHHFLVREALARIPRCQGGDADAIDEALREARLYVGATGDQAILDRLDELEELRADCT